MTSADRAGTIVVTGGNSGIGYAAVAAILASPHGPWHVIVASRDAGRAGEAVAKLAAGARPGQTVEAMVVDLGSLASIRTFAAELTARLAAATIPALRALVGNAGVQSGARLTRTVDGFETTFGVNHLGHFALVSELLPVLRAPARVIMVASDTHDPALKLGPAPAWTDPRALARGDLAPSATADNALVAGQRRYSTSKLANIYFTYALARRLPAAVTANAFNPGMVLGTNLGRSLPPPVRFAARHLLPRLNWLLRRVLSPNIHSAEEAGGALAWLATSPDVAGITGAYFDGREAARSSAESYDTRRADDLWTISQELTAPGPSVLI